MAIQSWDPLRDMRELQQKMNRLFDDALARSSGAPAVDSLAAGGWRPPTDLIEEAERFILRCDLPGVAATELEIRVEDGALYLRGDRRSDAAAAPESHLRVERPHGPFALRVALAPSVDVRGATAVHRDGVVEVYLPKRRAGTASAVEISAG